MSLSTLLLIPGVKSSLLLALGGGVMAVYARYRESRYYPVIAEVKEVILSFNSMVSDGKIDAQETEAAIEYVKCRLADVSAKLDKSKL